MSYIHAGPNSGGFAGVGGAGGYSRGIQANGQHQSGSRTFAGPGGLHPGQFDPTGQQMAAFANRQHMGADDAASFKVDAPEFKPQPSGPQSGGGSRHQPPKLGGGGGKAKGKSTNGSKPGGKGFKQQHGQMDPQQMMQGSDGWQRSFDQAGDGGKGGDDTRRLQQQVQDLTAKLNHAHQHIEGIEVMHQQALMYIEQMNHSALQTQHYYQSEIQMRDIELARLRGLLNSGTNTAGAATDGNDAGAGGPTGPPAAEPRGPNTRTEKTTTSAAPLPEATAAAAAGADTETGRPIPEAGKSEPAESRPDEAAAAQSLSSVQAIPEAAVEQPLTTTVKPVEIIDPPATVETPAAPTKDAAKSTGAAADSSGSMTSKSGTTAHPSAAPAAKQAPAQSAASASSKPVAPLSWAGRAATSGIAQAPAMVAAPAAAKAPPPQEDKPAPAAQQRPVAKSTSSQAEKAAVRGHGRGGRGSEGGRAGGRGGGLDGRGRGRGVSKAPNTEQSDHEMAKALDKELDSDSKVCPVVADDEGEWETKQSRATRGRQQSSKEDVRPIPSSMKPCKFWNPILKTGCREGDRCRYAHGAIPGHGARGKLGGNASIPSKRCELTTPEIVTLVEEREQVRLKKQWTKCDTLREKLRAVGISVHDDGPDGVSGEWKTMDGRTGKIRGAESTIVKLRSGKENTSAKASTAKPGPKPKSSAPTKSSEEHITKPASDNTVTSKTEASGAPTGAGAGFSYANVAKSK